MLSDSPFVQLPDWTWRHTIIASRLRNAQSLPKTDLKRYHPSHLITPRWKSSPSQTVPQLAIQAQHPLNLIHDLHINYCPSFAARYGLCSTGEANARTPFSPTGWLVSLGTPHRLGTTGNLVSCPWVSWRLCMYVFWCRECYKIKWRWQIVAIISTINHAWINYEQTFPRCVQLRTTMVVAIGGKILHPCCRALVVTGE